MIAPFADLAAEYAGARRRDAEFRALAKRVAALPQVAALSWRRGESRPVVLTCQGSNRAGARWHETGVLVALLRSPDGLDVQIRREHHATEVTAPRAWRGAERGGVLAFVCADCGRRHSVAAVDLLPEVTRSLVQPRYLPDGRPAVRLRS